MNYKPVTAALRGFHGPRIRMGTSVLLALALTPSHAEMLDRLVIGDAEDQAAHGLTVDLGEGYAGDSGEWGLRLLPKNPPDFYGGAMLMTMKVDSAGQNYFTAKLSGDEFRSDSDNGRLVLKCEGLELGLRHGSDQELFLDQSDSPISKGAFYYRTAPIPRHLTQGKTKVTFKLQATGRFFAYGTPWDYDSYQRKLLYPTRGIYGAYTHVNPYFQAPDGDKQGRRGDYAQAPVRPGPGEEKLAAFKTRVNDRITSLIKASGYLKAAPNNNVNTIEYLALAYAMPWTSGYRSQALLGKVTASLDSNAAAYQKDSTLARSAWGGAYGRMGYAIHLLSRDLKDSLDKGVDLGSGFQPRRKYWAAMLKASYDFGRMNRKSITNQEMEAAVSIYGANMGLRTVDTALAVPEASAKRYLLEALGLEEYRGNDLASGGSDWNKGHGFFMMTAKGTSHEPGWVSQDCYGNLGPKILEIARMSGDTSLLRRAVDLEKFQAHFRYPSVDKDGYRALLAEGVVCWRNVYHPGKVFYGCPWTAAASLDADLLGYQKQMLDDNQFFRLFAEEDDYLAESRALFLPEAYEKIKAASATRKNPCTPGQPDYALADEQNGVVAVKRGQEMFFISLYRRAYAINYLAKAHHITPQAERVIEFTVDDVRFTPSGKFKTLDGLVQSAFTGTPPDSAQSAYKGMTQPLPLLENGEVAHQDRALAEFYGCAFGDYRIGMNSSQGKTFTYDPPGFTSGFDLVSGRRIETPITLGPQTTVVLHVGLGAGLRGKAAKPIRMPFFTTYRSGHHLRLNLNGGQYPGTKLRIYSLGGEKIMERVFLSPILDITLTPLGRKTLFGEVRGKDGYGEFFRIHPAN